MIIGVEECDLCRQKRPGASELAQGVEVLAAKAQDVSSIPGIHMRQSFPESCPHKHLIKKRSCEASR